MIEKEAELLYRKANGSCKYSGVFRSASFITYLQNRPQLGNRIQEAHNITTFLLYIHTLLTYNLYLFTKIEGIQDRRVYICKFVKAYVFH